MEEADSAAYEYALREEGVPEREVGDKSAWRLEAAHDDVTLLDFYGEYLVGQVIGSSKMGMSEALRLEAVRAALEIEQVPREVWASVVRRLNAIHLTFMEIMRKKP